MISIMILLCMCFISGCRDKDPSISEWSGRCLGALGALEPSLLPRHQSAAQDRGTFAFSVGDTGFIRVALSELTRAFQCEKDTKVSDFCIRYDTILPLQPGVLLSPYAIGH